MMNSQLAFGLTESIDRRVKCLDRRPRLLLCAGIRFPHSFGGEGTALRTRKL
jgi:hypothetical protein